MKSRIFCCSFLLVALSICGAAVRHAEASEPNTVRIILVGDSTMATRTGYGDALCQLFQPSVTCINMARGGRSSASFRVEGLWDQMMSVLRTGGQYRASYVLIQFGHNDQPGKPGRSTDLATEFPVNIARYVDEVKSLGAIPVLVTPLTRRIFHDGVLKNDLTPWADATRLIAREKQVPLLDLNTKSAAAVSAMGTTEADTLAEEPPPKLSTQTPAKEQNDAKAEPAIAVKSRFDYTHLGTKGASYFAKMIAQDLVQVVPSLAEHIKPVKPTP